MCVLEWEVKSFMKDEFKLSVQQIKAHTSYRTSYFERPPKLYIVCALTAVPVWLCPLVPRRVHSGLIVTQPALRAVYLELRRLPCGLYVLLPSFHVVLLVARRSTALADTLQTLSVQR